MLRGRRAWANPANGVALPANKRAKEVWGGRDFAVPGLAYGLELRRGLLPKSRTKWSSYFKAAVWNARSVPALWSRHSRQSQSQKKVSQTESGQYLGFSWPSDAQTIKNNRRRINLVTINSHLSSHSLGLPRTAPPRPAHLPPLYVTADF